MFLRFKGLKQRARFKLRFILCFKLRFILRFACCVLCAELGSSDADAAKSSRAQAIVNPSQEVVEQTLLKKETQEKEQAAAKAGKKAEEKEKGEKAEKTEEERALPKEEKKGREEVSLIH